MTLATFGLTDNVKHSATATKEKVALEEKYGLAPGILGRDAPAGKGTKAPSIKDMKATIRKAGFGVADLVEKSEVEARYREAVVRLADIAKQDESYTGYFEREEDLK